MSIIDTQYMCCILHEREGGGRKVANGVKGCEMKRFKRLFTRAVANPRVFHVREIKRRVKHAQVIQA